MPNENQQLNETVKINGNNHKKIGPMISILVIVLVLIVACLYILASKINNSPLPEDVTTYTSSVTNSVQPTVAPVTNTSDDLNSLQNDLNKATNGI